MRASKLDEMYKFLAESMRRAVMTPCSYVKFEYLVIGDKDYHELMTCEHASRLLVFDNKERKVFINFQGMHIEIVRALKENFIGLIHENNHI